MIITTIQDNLYLSWQAELLALNCRELGQELTILSGWRGRPSEYALRLQRDFNAVLIEDTRQDISYAPSIQPHLLAKYSRDACHGILAPVMLVDSDVLFKSLDWFQQLKTQNSALSTVLLSDCSSYLDARYLTGTDPDLLGHLCRIAGIAPEYVRNHTASGGAQYILPHLFTTDFWQRIERNSNAMHRLMKHYTCSTHPVQKWTASMWAILYELYRREQTGECLVETSDRLKFCFATDPAHYWQERDILHMAGVVPGMKGYFVKGAYTTVPPWEADLSHVQPDNCSFVYVEAIKWLKPL